MWLAVLGSGVIKMSNYFLVKNSSTDSVLIDDTYVNLCLSRKFKANTLPVVTLTESAGYLVKGNPQLRKIDLYGGECVAAVGGYVNRRCPYFVFNCLKKNGSVIEVEHFLCSADTTNHFRDKSFPLSYNYPDDEPTNIASSYYVPDDLYVYTFSKSNSEIIYVSTLPASGNSEKRYCVTTGVNTGKTYIWSGSAWIETTNAATAEKVGFQVFNENGQTVFDSRFKYLDALDVNQTTRVSEKYDTNIAIAVADITPNIEYGTQMDLATGKTYKMFYAVGSVLFEGNYTSPSGSHYDKCHTGRGSRLFYRAEASQSFSRSTSHKTYMTIDVTGY